MSDIGKFVKGKFAEIVLNAFSNRIDGKEITENLDAELDKQFGEKTSERMQSKFIFNLLREMIEGLFSEDVGALRVKIYNWLQDIDATLKED